jgi:hypothetical protein
MPALVGIATYLRARPAAHALFELPDRSPPRSPQRREIHSAVRVAAGAFDLEHSNTAVVFAVYRLNSMAMKLRRQNRERD